MRDEGSGGIRIERRKVVDGSELKPYLFDLGGTLIDGRDFSGWSEDAQSLGLAVDAEELAAAWSASRPWENHREDSRSSFGGKSFRTLRLPRSRFKRCGDSW